MFCSECGHKLKDDAKFCENCGKALQGSAKSGENNQVLKLECPGCGANVASSDKKCNRCNAILSFNSKSGIRAEKDHACRLCNHESYVGQDACTECGFPLRDDALQKLQEKRKFEQQKSYDELGKEASDLIQSKSSTIFYFGPMEHPEEVYYVLTENYLFVLWIKPHSFHRL